MEPLSAVSCFGPEMAVYSAAGQLKDMAARSLLQKLHQRDLIALPERRRGPVGRTPPVSFEPFDAVVPESVVGDLSSLQPLEIQMVGPKQPDYQLFRRYLAQHHYLSLSLIHISEPTRPY